jgi:cytosine/adenosine deaminase-related metal-dependent hydrolase
MSRLLVAGGELLAGPGRRLERADVLIDSGSIARVGPDLAVPQDTARLDATGTIVMPGLINAHTHGHNNLARGMAGRWTLEQLISFGPAIQANRSAEDHYLSAAVGAIEMLKTGATSAYDLYMSVPVPDEEVLEPVVEAYRDVGLRVVLSPSLADGPFYRMMPGLLEVVPRDVARRLQRLAAVPARRSLELTQSAIRRFDGAASGRIRIGVSPTIPGQCSDELLRGLAEVALDHGVGMHTHVAESRVQIAQARLRWGRSIVSQLAELGVLRAPFVAAHGVWLTADEIRQLANADATVAHNPASNLRLGNGIAPVREMLAAGLNVALGSDGSLSSDNQDMFEAMRLAALVSRADPSIGPERWLDATEALERATVAGATALSCRGQLGLIEPGRRADIVLLRAESTFLHPRNELLNALVFAETGAAVQTVIIDGRVVLEEGRVTGVDEGAIRDRARASVERLSAANRELLQAAAQLSPYVVAHCQAMLARGEASEAHGMPAGGPASEGHGRELGLGEAAI